MQNNTSYTNYSRVLQMQTVVLQMQNVVLHIQTMVLQMQNRPLSFETATYTCYVCTVKY